MSLINCQGYAFNYSRSAQKNELVDVAVLSVRASQFIDRETGNGCTPKNTAVTAGAYYSV